MNNKGPELDVGTAGTLDYGETAGRYGPARLQTLLLRVEVVAIAQAAPIMEGLTGHGSAIVVILLYHPQAGAFGVAELAGIFFLEDISYQWPSP